MNLKDKKILITGASNGMGQAIAVSCAQKGAIVLINYRKISKAQSKLSKKLRKPLR